MTAVQYSECSGTFRHHSGTLPAPSVPPPLKGGGTEHSNGCVSATARNARAEHSTVCWFPLPAAASTRSSAARCREGGCGRPVVIHPDFDPYRPLQEFTLPRELCIGHGQMWVAAQQLAAGGAIEDDTIEYAKQAFDFDYQCMQMHQAATSVYRLFGESANLLYVGITNDITRRLRQHARERPWWHEVRAHTHHVFTDRHEALAAEAHAITSERPKYNILGQPSTSITRPSEIA